MSTESEVKRFDKYIAGIMPDCFLYDFKSKKRCVAQHVSYMLNRTQRMFEYKGLPDSIPARVLELYLQMNGNACFYKYNDTLYVFTGGMGGEPDVYYRPTIYTIANPALKLSKSLKIDTECVVVPNDSLYVGLMPLFERYGTAIMETELSLKIATTNARLTSFISAPDDRTKKSAEKYLTDLENGENGVAAENAFLDGIRVQPYGVAGSRTFTDLIELEQYWKASEFNEIGLNANYNMKRESLNTSESQMNNDALLPLADDMLNQRKIGMEKVNAMFGTNITVDFASSWEDNAEEIELEHNNMNGGMTNGTQTTD